MAPAAAVLQNPFPTVIHQDPAPLEQLPQTSGDTEVMSELSPPQSLQSTHDKPGCKTNIPAKNKTNISHRFSEGTPISQPQEPAGTAPSTSPALPMAIPAQPSWCPEKPPWGGRRATETTPARWSRSDTRMPNTGKALLGMFPCCPVPLLTGGTGRGVPTPVALLWGVSAVSGLKIQFFHPAPSPHQVSHPAYQPLPKGILKFLNSQGSVRL